MPQHEIQKHFSLGITLSTCSESVYQGFLKLVSHLDSLLKETFQKNVHTVPSYLSYATSFLQWEQEKKLLKKLACI